MKQFLIDLARTALAGFLIATMIIGLLLFASAQASQCGWKPYPPIECVQPTAVCLCDDSGCRWVWVCD